MSYQVLARKWRPRTFDQVVGQQHVLQALVNALDSNRLHHAYLFTGTRGVGKTSIARLLAKALNCEKNVSSNPCGKCQSCIEIDQGNFVDLIEIDAASKTKVEDTRDILDNVQYKPTRGRYKVYLIDEVHMLSRSSFNALLKTLEEPPEHVKFLFATTEAHKLPVTILSRCLQFNLKAINAEQIAGQLTHILDQENVTADPAALKLIADAADGSMRDALSLTDQAISFGNGTLTLTDVANMLGTLDSNYSIELLLLAAQASGEKLMNRVAGLSQFAPDYDNLLKQMAKDVHLAAMSQVVKSSARLANEPKDVVALATSVEPELLQLFYNILLQGRQELAFAPDPRSGFEMVLLRLLAFMPKEPIAQDDAPPVQVALGKASPDNDAESNTLSELSALTEQQNSILQQAKQLTSHESAVSLTSTKPVTNQLPASEPAVASPEIATPEITAPAMAEPQVTAPQFSEQELLNMSQALAAQEQQQSEETQYIETQRTEPQPHQSTPPSVAQEQGASGINDFLNARKALRNKVINTANATEATEKKPQAVKTLTKTKVSNDSSYTSRSLSPVSTTAIAPSTSAPLIQDQSSGDSVGDSTGNSISVSNGASSGNGVSNEQQESRSGNSSSSIDSSVDPATLLAPNTDDPWSQLIDQMGLTGRLRLLAVQSSFNRQDDNVTLLLRAEHRHLLASSTSDQIEQLLHQHLAPEITLTIEIGSDQQLTPDQLAINLHQQRLELASQCIETDTFIRQFEQRFDAQVNRDSINYRRLNKVS